jgi:putative two-component system response regulator
MVLRHQERYDGTGYPQKLKREQILLAARIFALVDTFDAMTSDRPYRKALLTRMPARKSLAVAAPSLILRS